MDLEIVLIYRSPNAREEAMDELVSVVRGAGKNTVMLGDFNLPDIDWEEGTASRRATAFMEAVDEAAMEQLVEFATQVRGNRLDLVISNIPERVMDLKEEGRLGSSDHDMISVQIGVGPMPDATKVIKN